MTCYTLQEKQTAILKRCRKILCQRGTLWITWPGSPDMILQASEEIIISPGKGKIIIQNLGTGIARLDI
ncbi:hypothetical protein [Oceanispirochaeta sp.]|uniref:hypothetical protein n=1 Tax=Oceanispirochaeta sp. TaxID=2035350 RepID=UPI00261441AB|nr:hypothetical protein [Oceanispirochaeta sp.]MDA3958904.1 hypothetical protein [Oceanispirochaeta sp.]